MESKPSILDDDDDFDLDLSDILGTKGAPKKAAPTKLSDSSKSALGSTGLGADLLGGQQKGMELKRCKHGLLMFSPLDSTHGKMLSLYGQYSEGEVDVRSACCLCLLVVLA